MLARLSFLKDISPKWLIFQLKRLIFSLGCSLSVCMNDGTCVLGKFDLHCLLRKGYTHNYRNCGSPEGMKMWVSYERYQYQIDGSCKLIDYIEDGLYVT